MIFNNILEEYIEIAKDFVNSDNKDKKKELTNILIDNGINEKNPFDPDVISNAVNVSFDIYKKEIEIFLTVYERTRKLFEELEANDVKLDKHKKLINDSNSKLHFLSAKKDYIVGFLDNERIAAIYDKKIHRKLMLEACRNLNDDLVHIDSLYDILLKEIASRASKRLYKDNYNKSYLLDIAKVSDDVGEEINKLKANSVAVVNLNYWRIDGISKIQDVFERDVKQVYGRDLDAIFPKTEDNVDNSKNESTEIKNVNSNKKSENDVKKSQYKNLKSSKEVLKNAINKLENNSNDELNDNDLQEDDTDYNNLFEKISMLDELDDNESINPKSTIDIKQNKNSDDNNEDIDDNIEDKDDEINSDNEIEESIFDYYFKESDLSERKRKLRDEKKLNEDNHKSNIIKKIIGFNSKKQKEA